MIEYISEFVDYDQANMPDYLIVREREGKVAFAILGPMQFNFPQPIARANEPPVAKRAWAVLLRVDQENFKASAHDFRQDAVRIGPDMMPWLKAIEADGWEAFAVAGPITMPPQRTIVVAGQDQEPPDTRLIFFLRKPSGLTIAQVLEQQADQQFKFKAPMQCPNCGSEKVRQTSNRAAGELQCIKCQSLFTPGAVNGQQRADTPTT